MHLYLSKASFKRIACTNLISIVRKLVILIYVGCPSPYQARPNQLGCTVAVGHTPQFTAVDVAPPSGDRGTEARIGMKRALGTKQCDHRDK